MFLFSAVPERTFTAAASGGTSLACLCEMRKTIPRYRLRLNLGSYSWSGSSPREQATEIYFAFSFRHGEMVAESFIRDTSFPHICGNSSKNRVAAKLAFRPQIANLSQVQYGSETRDGRQGYLRPRS